MRYDKLIYFVKLGKSIYNDKTGNYLREQPTKTPCMVSIMDTREERKQLIYGTLKQKSYTIYCLNHYNEIYDYIEIDGRRYKVDYSRKFRREHSFVVSEVQHGDNL